MTRRVRYGLLEIRRGSWVDGRRLAPGDIVDLDGPLFLQRDRSPGVVYANGYVDCPASVWGNPDVLL